MVALAVCSLEQVIGCRQYGRFAGAQQQRWRRGRHREGELRGDPARRCKRSPDERLEGTLSGQEISPLSFAGVHSAGYGKVGDIIAAAIMSAQRVAILTTAFECAHPALLSGVSVSIDRIPKGSIWPIWPADEKYNVKVAKWLSA
jgi:hypothetical protein